MTWDPVNTQSTLSGQARHLRTMVGMTRINALLFGARGDDAGDDTDAIQAAIDTADRMGGGLVELPPGLFTVQNIVIRPRVTIKGSGMGVSTLKLRSGAPAGSSVLITANYAALTGKTGSELLANGGALMALAPSRFSLYDLTLDGNKANNPSAGSALEIFGAGYRLRSVEIRDSGGIGFRGEWPPGIGSVNAGYPLQCTHDDVRVHECTGDGMYLNGPSDGFFTGCALYQNGTNAINCQSQGSGHKFTACHVWGTNHQRGLLVQGSGINVANCSFEGATLAQYDIQASGFVYAGGFSYAGVTEPNSYTCFRVAAFGYNIQGRVSGFNTAIVNFASDPSPGGYIDVEGYTTQAASTHTGSHHADSFVRLARKIPGSATVWYAHDPATYT